ncbi:ribonuclease H-like domain-containing protein [Tanacetum coccineum]
MTHPSPKKNMVPGAVLMRSCLVSLTTAKPLNTAQPRTTVNRNMSYLTNYEEIDGGYVAFGGNPKGGKITGKCTIKTGIVSLNDTECIVLSPNFKLTDESQVLLKVPRKNNMYSVDLKNIVPKGGLTCLFAKATYDESELWHRRLGHINFKTMNKVVQGNLVRGLPSKLFENNQTCVACQKGKQHRASLVQKRQCDNGTEFKNKEMNQFCKRKGIKREFSVARTPQQNRVAERKNRTLIEAARTMLADSKLPTTFWAEAVNTACYVQNRFSKNTPNIEESGPNWLFDIDALTKSMNYKPVVTGNQSNGNACTKACDDAGKDRMETVPGDMYGYLSKQTKSKQKRKKPSTGMKRA